MFRNVETRVIRRFVLLEEGSIFFLQKGQNAISRFQVLKSAKTVINLNTKKVSLMIYVSRRRNESNKEVCFARGKL